MRFFFCVAFVFSRTHRTGMRSVLNPLRPTGPPSSSVLDPLTDPSVVAAPPQPAFEHAGPRSQNQWNDALEFDRMSLDHIVLAVALVLIMASAIVVILTRLRRARPLRRLRDMSDAVAHHHRREKERTGKKGK